MKLKISAQLMKNENSLLKIGSLPIITNFIFQNYLSSLKTLTSLTIESL